MKKMVTKDTKFKFIFNSTQSIFGYGALKWNLYIFCIWEFVIYSSIFNMISKILSFKIQIVDEWTQTKTKTKTSNSWLLQMKQSQITVGLVNVLIGKFFFLCFKPKKKKRTTILLSCPFWKADTKIKMKWYIVQMQLVL